VIFVTMDQVANDPSICHNENILLDPCLQMVRTRGTMDMFEELPEINGCHQAPPPPPYAPVALDQLLTTQNDLMQRLVVNEECRKAREL
jgi:hypothetical protein